jgi:hypothetical protein
MTAEFFVNVEVSNEPYRPLPIIRVVAAVLGVAFFLSVGYWLYKQL